MRPGDVVQNHPDSGLPVFQCHGCDKWLRKGEYKQVGDCGHGCCNDYKCNACGHETRVEWPD